MQALDLYRAAVHRPGQAMVLAHCEQALAAVRELGERNWEAATWDSLGYIHDQLGNHERAVACYERAVALYRELADRFNEADTLDHLGDTQHSAGDIQAARRTWTSALCSFGEIEHPDGDQVRAKLNRTSRQPDASSAVAAP